MSFFSSRRILLLLAAAGLVAVGIVFYLRQTKPSANLPGPGDARYATYVSAFQMGTAQLDADLTDEAEKNLSKAIETIPEEPAAWANRALLHMRGFGQLKEAGSDLAKARELAPDNADLEEIAGFLAEQNNKLAEAREHFRKASAASPRNIRRLYQIAELTAKLADPDANQQRLAIFEQILDIDPDNLPVLSEAASLAVLANDRAAFQKTLARLDKLSTGWHKNTKDQLILVKKDSENLSSSALEDKLRGLGNLLMQETGYARMKENLSPQGAKVGTTFQTFIRLAPVQSAPAEPDLQLTFKAVVPLILPEVMAKKWSGVIPLWLDGNSPPSIFVADNQIVRAANKSFPSFEFPAGPERLPPGIDGIVGVDWDNDQYPDILLAGSGGLRFHVQVDIANVAAAVVGPVASVRFGQKNPRPSGYFEDVTAKTLLAPDLLSGNYYGAWAIDVDFDGDLDILLARRKGEPLLLRNNFDGTFTAQTIFPGVSDARAFAWLDLDNDGAADAALLDGAGHLHIFMNQRKGVFTRRAVPDEKQTYCALAVADVNDDGVFDLIALTQSGSLVRIADRNKGTGWDVGELGKLQGDLPLVIGTVRLIAIDLDNNGAIDLVLRTPAGGSAWLADGKGSFQLLPVAVPQGIANIVDLNDSGSLDFLGLDAQGHVIEEEAVGTKDYHWHILKPRSVNAADNRVNSFGRGGNVELRTGLLVIKQMIDQPTIHLGIGTHESVDVLKVDWPNGTSQHEFGRNSGSPMTLVQRLKGSCPFLYTWNGEQMVFVTDFCWSTPLGMYINAQDKGGFLQTTDWVKIRQNQLVPRAGIYDVRVNANLWETHYLDELGLMVVDHPPGTEVHIDERFFLEPTKPQVYLTGPAKPVAQAWDHQGHDVTDIVRVVDGNYLDRCGRGIYQGITNDHWVEIDLGNDAPKTGPVYLLGTGWIHPTDSSINFALGQNKSIKPQPLTLEIPDGKGGWKVGRGGLGFLAGKNKTCVIRLDGIEGDKVTRRFRLRTNLEVYWDALQYATGLNASQIRQQRLAAQTADLSFRGVLRMTQASPSAPELPHYDEVLHRGKVWRDLTGFHTRFGDVSELIAKSDDRYVIMNAGDELRLTYSVPAAPPVGWVRDFVWICDGWVKDGDLNTRWSKTVLPLPYHGMKDYETPPGRLEDDPVYRRFPEDWKRYHTRYVTPTQYERGLRAFRNPR